MACAAVLLAGCPKANSDFAAAKKAELLSDYDTALVHYERALRDQPNNPEFRLHTIQMRMQDSQYHEEQGEKALKAGNLQMALAEFQRAQAVDPSNQAADQGVKKTMEQIAAKNAPAASTNTAVEGEDTALLSAPPELTSASHGPVNLSMVNQDSRVVYQTIAKLAGWSVIFDPQVAQRRITVDFTDVTYEQALDLVNAESGNFWKPMTSTVIFVAPDNPQKRRDVEDEEVATIYLANTETPQDLTEIVTALRQLLDLRRVQPVQSQNAIIIRDTSDKIALARKIIADSDKAKPEVLLHIQVLTANVDRLRNLGILTGQSAALTFTPPCVLASSSSNCSSSTPASGSSTGSNPAVTLNNLRNLSTGAYSLTLPGATATAILTDNQTRIIQDPEVRITDGDKATVKIGEQVPIATGSFQAGVGVSSTSVSPLVNTQFTYQQVGVNIDVTPRVHPNGDVSMKLAVAVTALAGSTNIGGINQPIISGPSVDGNVRLANGEVSVLGGLIQRTETKNLNGVPGVSQIPLLKDIFSDNSKDVQENEVLIVITPHVIRFPDIQTVNLQTVASGTDTNARVFRGDASPQASSAPTTSAPGAQQLAPASAASQATAANGNPPATGAAAAQLHFEPSTSNMKVGDTQTIALGINGASDLYSIPLMIRYNPAVVEVQEVRDGGFLSGGTQAIAIVQQIDKANGQVIVSATRRPNTPGVSGAGTIIALVVHAIAPGTSPLQILQVNAHDSQQRPIPLVSSEGTIQVQ